MTSYTLTGSPEDFPTLPPIGTAIDGATVSLLGADLRPVPPGTKGEIYIGGRCLALGYEGRPDLTAERFVMIGEHGERMYRTGDLGVQLPTGDLVYLGRADTQVKVRGFRVECAEVELALMNLNDKAIRAAAVVARQPPVAGLRAGRLSGRRQRSSRPRGDPSPLTSGTARLHDPGALPVARRVPAHAQRQARRQGAARAAVVDRRCATSGHHTEQHIRASGR